MHFFLSIGGGTWNLYIVNMDVFACVNIRATRVVAREFLVPGGIYGIFLWNWQFYWKLPKYGQILCDFTIFDTWVLGARAEIVCQWWALYLSAGLCRPPPPAVATSLRATPPICSFRAQQILVTINNVWALILWICASFDSQKAQILMKQKHIHIYSMRSREYEGKCNIFLLDGENAKYLGKILHFPSPSRKYWSIPKIRLRAICGINVITQCH